MRSSSRRRGQRASAPQAAERSPGKRSSRPEFRPIFFLLSAPSGTGKGTLVRALLRNDRHLRHIVTCTTRARREGERNGVDYHFFLRQQFAEAIERGEFIEWNEIYGDYYGTHRALVTDQVERARRRHDDLLLQIDVEGKRRFAAQFDPIVSVFILPPSLDELRQRIWNRRSETPQQMERRLARAQKELACKDEYDHVVVNEHSADAARRLADIINAERHRLRPA